MKSKPTIAWGLKNKKTGQISIAVYHSKFTAKSMSDYDMDKKPIAKPIKVEIREVK